MKTLQETNPDMYHRLEQNKKRRAEEAKACKVIGLVLVTLLICSMLFGCAIRQPGGQETLPLETHLQEARKANVAAFGEYKGIRTLSRKIGEYSADASANFAMADGKTARALKILDYIRHHHH